MVFKELEIQGFKSFPDKVKIRFDEGVTGVVGPNGSGKSNLSDAVRWVLGNSDCVARGEGRSKKMAEQHAAREALKLLGVIKEK